MPRSSQTPSQLTSSRPASSAAAWHRSGQVSVSSQRVQRLGGKPYRLPPTCATCDGYGLHAGVVIGAKDRKGLEGLARYIARPPLATPRLEELPNGGLRIRFKRPRSDGTEGIDLSRIELIERLAALVPPPHANTVFYHGVLAARSALRPRA